MKKEEENAMERVAELEEALENVKSILNRIGCRAAGGMPPGTLTDYARDAHLRRINPVVTIRPHAPPDAPMGGTLFSLKWDRKRTATGSGK